MTTKAKITGKIENRILRPVHQCMTLEEEMRANGYDRDHRMIVNEKSGRSLLWLWLRFISFVKTN